MKNNSYEDIINLPHPVSKNHPQMPLRDRLWNFVIENGFCSNAVNHMIKDSEEQIWVATREGLAVLTNLKTFSEKCSLLMILFIIL